MGIPIIARPPRPPDRCSFRARGRTLAESQWRTATSSLITGALDRDRRRDRAPGRGARLPGGARRALRGQARRSWQPSSAAPSRRSRCAATSPSGPTTSGSRPRRLEAFGRIDAVFANAGFGATRGFLEETARAVALDGADQRPRRRLHDPGDPPPPAGAGHRPLRDHQLGRRAAGCCPARCTRRRSGP